MSAFLNIDHGDRSWIAGVTTALAVFTGSTVEAAAAGADTAGCAIAEGAAVCWAKTGEASAMTASAMQHFRMFLNDGSIIRRPSSE